MGPRCQKQQAYMSDLTPRLVAGSVGAIVTALAVTPLEVVKVRQQAGAKVTVPYPLPPNVSPCPRGCGTFVLNNGLMDCLLPKSAVPYFDKWGNLSECAAQITPVAKASSQKAPGTFQLLRNIFMKEGLGGIYAGLPATLAMSIPNTVLYFTSYDEIVSQLRRRLGSSSVFGDYSSVWVPLVGGSTARFVASIATAPLELVRTRQAACVGDLGEAAPSLWTEFRTMIKTDGVTSLYRGLAPTLWRDVPFSAIYWLCLEGFKREWKRRDKAKETPLRAAGHAFFSGAAAGMIAAAATTPFDVVKTRQQVIENPAEMFSSSAGAVCHHHGAITYKHPTHAISTDGSHGAGTLKFIRNIVANEGIGALWTGNQTRMLKVAPACAIMISCYELGKRIME